MQFEQCLIKFSESSSIVREWETAIIGKSVDERGDKMAKLLREHSRKTSEISYNFETFEIRYDNQIFTFEKFDLPLQDRPPIIVDLTTVGFIETLYLLKVSKSQGVEIEFIYCEPKNYLNHSSEDGLIKKQFILSSDINNFNSVPGFTSMDNLHEVHEYVFMAGYEANRIEAAFEYKENIQGANSHIIFGVPPYVAGWEMNSFFNNINIISSKNINGSISYNGASDVLNIFSELTRIQSSIQSDDFNLCILPFANKPSSLATALFLIQNEDNSSLLYDHPFPAKSRTSEMGNIHVYKIGWS